MEVIKDECISKLEVIRILQKAYAEGRVKANDGLVSVLDDINASDVKPVKHGHWYHNTSKYVSELDAYFIQACCSCCNRYSDRIDQYSQIMLNETCSHCGADMRGEKNA